MELGSDMSNTERNSSTLKHVCCGPAYQKCVSSTPCRGGSELTYNIKQDCGSLTLLLWPPEGKNHTVMNKHQWLFQYYHIRNNWGQNVQLLTLGTGITLCFRQLQLQTLHLREILSWNTSPLYTLMQNCPHSFSQNTGDLWVHVHGRLVHWAFTYYCYQI